MISYGRQSISQADIDSVAEVLRSEWLTQGPAIEAFEAQVASYCGAKYAVALNSATSALHVACLAAELHQGDVLWTSPNTFVASANCALYCGAKADFVDISDDTYNMNIDLLEKKLETGARPKVVVPVHFAGQSCDMRRIGELAKKYNFMVIEDASHAVGASYEGEKIGSCRYSDMVIFSFHPVKIVTSAEGGMILTNNKVLYERALLFRSHGITRKEEFMENQSQGPWYYEQIDLGFNYRMTDMQAALGYSQMQRVNEFVCRRSQLARQYDDMLEGLPLRLPCKYSVADSSWHLYVVRYDFMRAKISKNDLFARMKDKEVLLNLHYIPVHIQPYYRRLGFKKGDFPITEKYYEEVFTLPLYYGLTDGQQKEIVKSLSEVLADGGI